MTFREDDSEADFAGWAPPLILDRLSEVYFRAHPANPLRAAFLVALHARVWRALICGEEAKGKAMRKELVREAEHAHLNRDDVLAADKEVLKELFTVVRQRFRTSRHLSLAYMRPLRDAMEHVRGTKLAA